MGVNAGLIKAFGEFIQYLAQSPLAMHWRWNTIIVGLYVLFGLVARVTDSGDRVNLAAKTLHFAFGFEFTRMIVIMTCGLFGQESFQAIVVILGVPALDLIWGIKTGIPVLFLTAERQSAAQTLYRELGPPVFYSIFVALPVWLIATRVLRVSGLQKT